MKPYPKKVLDKIKTCQETQATVLDLSTYREDERLIEIPPAVFELTQLVELRLAGHAIEIIPPEIQRLTQLQCLDVRENPLQAVAAVKGLWVDFSVYQRLSLPRENIQGLLFTKEDRAHIGEVTDFPDLLWLDLDHCQLEEIPPVVVELSNLTVLSFYNNSLTALPDSVGQLPNLTQLDISENRLTALPDSVGQLQNLTQLDISGNQLTALPDSIGQLPNLTQLVIGRNRSGNQLTALPDSIGQLPNLTELNLRGNQLTALPDSIGQLQNLTQLNLERNRLTALPDSIGQLPNLTELDISVNPLTALPDSIGQLPNLTELDISVNPLTALPDSIGQLPNLTQLDISGNQLTALPDSIGQLPNLTQLYISENRLTALPDSIGQLQNLTVLHIRGNQLTALPDWIGQLQNLTVLGLGGNQLTTLPDSIGQLQNLTLLVIAGNQLTALPDSIGQLSDELVLDVRGNPLKYPPLEIATQGEGEEYRGYKSIPAIRAYFADCAQGHTPNYEAKLILVGNGRSGKTSLFKSLTGQPIDPNEKSTHGIHIQTLDLPLDNGITLKLNVWDFGGQEIYHATHRFFLTNRALYLLLWDQATLPNAHYPEPNQFLSLEALQDYNYPLDYWLDNVQTLSNNSPIIVVQNKIDQHGKQWLGNEQALQEEYPIQDFLHLSAKTKKGIKQLQATLKEQYQTAPGLSELIGYPFPNSWLKIRQTLQSRRAENTLSYQTYLDICQPYGVTGQAAKTLCQFLHDTAVIFHFADSENLNGLVIVNPIWATEQVYKILNHSVAHAHGKFDRRHVQTILDSFDRQEQDKFLELLQQFELIFVHPTEPDIFIAPQFLDTKPPELMEEIWRYQGHPQLIYQYRKFIHKSIMVRFLARFGNKADYWWQKGLLLKRKPYFIRIESDETQRQIRITINSTLPPATLLTDIVKAFEEINPYQVEKHIPCICPQCQQDSKPFIHNLKDLIDSLDHQQLQQQCGKSRQMVDIRQLIRWDLEQVKTKVEELENNEGITKKRKKKSLWRKWFNRIKRWQQYWFIRIIEILAALLTVWSFFD